MVPEHEPLRRPARTVAHLAAYFPELQAHARAMLAGTSARQRGYFTPSEDERVRQLLISYWQARRALLETVVLLRDDATLSPTTRPAAFLVAFAGAALLVDGALFLREQFHEQPLIRGKLNEPEPHFGIPAGVYDAVQKSLTNPWNAWHLHHACNYLAEHQAELHELSQTTWLAPCWQVIATLSSRVDQALASAVTRRVRFRAHETVRLLRHDLLGQALYGVQKLVASLTAGIFLKPWHHPGLPHAVREELQATLRPGDVLVTRKEHALTNYFLPGFWPHAALYLGDWAALVQLGISTHAQVLARRERLAVAADPHRVLEAMADGVRIRSLASPLGVDAVAVIRPQLQEPEVAHGLTRGLFHEGKPYDFDFDFSRSDRLVCTEVVYRAYDGLGQLKFPLTRRAGRLTLAAEDLLALACQSAGFDPIAAYVPGTTQGVVRGTTARAVLARGRS